MAMLAAAERLGYLGNDIDKYLSCDYLDTLAKQYTTKECSDYERDNIGANYMYNGDIALDYRNEDLALLISCGIAQEIGIRWIRKMTISQQRSWLDYIIDKLHDRQAHCRSTKGSHFGYSYNVTNSLVCYRYHATISSPRVIGQFPSGTIVVKINTKNSFYHLGIKPDGTIKTIL